MPGPTRSNPVKRYISPDHPKDPPHRGIFFCLPRPSLPKSHRVLGHPFPNNTISFFTGAEPVGEVEISPPSLLSINISFLYFCFAFLYWHSVSCLPYKHAYSNHVLRFHLLLSIFTTSIHPHFVPLTDISWHSWQVFLGGMIEPRPSCREHLFLHTRWHRGVSLPVNEAQALIPFREGRPYK